MMGSEKFRGDDTGPKPHNFIGNFQVALADHTPAKHVEWFPKFLEEGSVAEDWYEELTAAEQGDWTELQRKFKERWPKSRKIKRSEGEIVEEMLGLKMQQDDIGTKIKIQDTDVWHHHHWATKMWNLACEAKVQNSSNSIVQVRKDLPKMVRSMIKGEYGDWKSFIDDVRAISGPELKEKMEDERKEKEEVARIASRSVPQVLPETPRSRSARIGMEGMAIGRGYAYNQPPQAYAPPPPSFYPRGGFRGRPAPRGTAFQTFQPRQPYVALPSTNLSTAQQAELREALKEFKVPENEQEYQAQMTTYQHKYSTSPMSHKTPHPLSPGTLPADQASCWDCGNPSHTRPNHPPETPRVPKKEFLWRKFVYMALNPRSDVRYIGYDYEDGRYGGQGGYDSYGGYFGGGYEGYGASQGNGEGPSA